MSGSKKKKEPPVDGLSAKDIANIRIAVRRVWSWSHMRRLATNRALGEDGYYYCEMCKKRTPKIRIDHIEPVGNVDGGFVSRLFCPSSGLQSLCVACHNQKTREERKAASNAKKDSCTQS